jgi:hypothetical protein
MTQQEYVQAREKLIPLAEKAAYEQVGHRPPGPHEEWAVAWNKVFHETMKHLAWEEGLTR